MDESAPREELPWYIRFIAGRRPWVTLIRAAVWVGLLLFVFKVVLLPIRVTGHSMEPTYRNGQVNFINRLAYRSAKPQRGDIVAVQMAGFEVVLLKRIIALPGERLAIRQGVVYLDGRALDEPYAKGRTSFRAKEFSLETNQYFVIGDNREVSDAHLKYTHQIVGRVLF